jgi:hypothetical protein
MLPRALLPALCALAAIASAPSRAADHCDLRWQLTPRLDTTPPHVAVRLSFDAGDRERSVFDLPPGAAVNGHALPSGQAIESTPAEPGRWVVRHPPGARVDVDYRIEPPAESIAGLDGARFGERWVRLFGDAWVALPADGAGARRLCVDLDAWPDGRGWLGSFGAAPPGHGPWRIDGAPAALRQTVLVGGELSAVEQRIGERTLRVAAPATGDVDAARLAERAARLAEAAQRLWRDAALPPPLVVVEPGRRGEPPAARADAARQALVLRLDPATPVAGGDDVLARELLHASIPDRFGPSAYVGRDDAAQRAWFGDGFAEHFAHRVLIGSTLWTADDYAAAMNAVIARFGTAPPAAQSDAALRGEWLALRWHAALRARGHPGLDSVMRSLLLPPSQARHEGPLSRPLVVHRLLAALRPWLGEAPLADLHAVVEQRQPLEFDERSLGPCFAWAPEVVPGGLPAYRARPDALREPACRDWMAIGAEADAHGVALAAPNGAPRVRAGLVGTKLSKAAKGARDGKVATARGKPKPARTGVSGKRPAAAKPRRAR